MYPAAFDYYRATTLQEALSLLKQHPEAKVLAGGHSLIPLMKLRLASPPALVDIGRISELKGIRRTDGTVVIGALTTHREVEFSEALKQWCPLLPEVAAQIGDPAVRNMGTIGGSLAHADPAADYPAAMLALGASMKAVGPGGERMIPAEAFFVGMLTTALQPGEILTEVHVPVLGPGTGWAYEKFPHPASRYAVVGVAAVVRVEGGVCREARVGITGAAPKAFRATAIEQALAGRPLEEATIRAAVEKAVSPEGLLSDPFASAEYRAHLCAVLARRALLRAASRAA